MGGIDEKTLINRMDLYGDTPAITDSTGAYTYSEIRTGAHRIASGLLASERDLGEQRVAIMASPGYDYTVALLGVWFAGGIAVPLCIEHPAAEIQYVLDDTRAEKVIISTEFEERFRELENRGLLQVQRISELVIASLVDLPEVSIDRRAMILYTSGTTSRPKGVVTTHRNISAQIECLIDAWGWTADDRILLFLPLHHVHGIINVLCCSLWIGARCDVLPKFDAKVVWSRILEGDLSLLMAVPTIYVKLIAAYEDADADIRSRYAEAAARFRLMVSGSAALPVSVLEKWRSITGHTLLERYGMTEIGMALSNPLHGERRPGFVGAPLPGVETRLADETGNTIDKEGEQGEICVQGPSVFPEYWEREDATRDAFRDGWFMTGDIAVLDDGAYRILGRSSVDIIKSGGYKISALEIEEVLRTHVKIQECAVVGVPDDEWGERVSVAVVLGAGQQLSVSELRDWAADKLAKYKIPSLVQSVESLPRNVMGKVTKVAVRELFES